MAFLVESNPDPDNSYARLIRNQKYAIIPSFQLESGETLSKCPIAYKTWGSLNENRDNVDVSDWWSPLIGPGKAFDPRHFFIFCGNVFGSPYGSASPLTKNPNTGRRYAGEFPQTTIRDDVRAHKLVLDALGVKSVATVIGGSMGGMATLEWPLCTPSNFVKNIIPIATAADHSAWGISWVETQRQCIYSDPKFLDGRYEPTPEGQPSAGLAAARMIAMLTYRSCTSFDNRFGRRPLRELNKPKDPPLDLPRTESPAIEPAHGRSRRPTRDLSFSAQGYLRYQGKKFISRFDANCYLHITYKMDSHDVAYGRTKDLGDRALSDVLSRVPFGALVIGVETDALFLPEQQERLVACLPGASLSVLESSDGHDGFLLEFDQLDALIQTKLRSDLPHLYATTNKFEETFDLDITDPSGRSLTGEVERW
ncbi:homoserine o-acetyltransferase [Colletotrichum truncatum]|uniref:Homoserine o-acetyltransferase n=1 Tax=Colletotrichum truncatum TaxID=5467 RepID=A0ACC3YPZ7_COLTU